MKETRPDTGKTNRRIILTVLSACAGVILLAGIAAHVAMDGYVRHLAGRLYAEMDRGCPVQLDSVTVMEEVRFDPETWTVSRTLRMSEIDRSAHDSLNRYRLDTLTRDRKNRIIERMQNHPFLPSPVVPANASFPERAAAFVCKRLIRKLSMHTVYLDKHGDFIMEITMAPEDFEAAEKHQEIPKLRPDNP